MATGKKSVLLYCDLIYTIEKMDDKTAGEFFKHYLRYINDLNPKTNNPLVDIVFESVKQNLKRDLKKWELRAERSRLNGAKGGRPKKPKETQKTQQVISKPKKPDTVTVNVTDTVNDILLEKETKELFNEWIKYRKEIKKPIKSNRTLVSLAKKIKKEGFEKSKTVIISSIENGWQGLFWDKYVKNNNKQDHNNLVMK
jgi:hypothetical protein